MKQVHKKNRPVIKRSITLAAEGAIGRKTRTAIVRRAPQGWGTRHLGLLQLDGAVYRCALGRSGITSNKREGDGATPRTRMLVLGGAYRPDKVAKSFGSESKKDNSFWQRIKPSDGWCDAPFTAAYNQHVCLPHAASHETMTRNDHLYDRLLVLDWNISTRRQLRGSAIFFHQARVAEGSMKPTEGCIALPAPVFAKLATRLVRLDNIWVL